MGLTLKGRVYGVSHNLGEFPNGSTRRCLLTSLLGEFVLPPAMRAKDYPSDGIDFLYGYLFDVLGHIGVVNVFTQL